MAKEGNEGVLLNACLDERDIYDLEPIAVDRKSDDIYKNAINILDLNVLYP
jgi:hypothetical protein